MNNIEKVKQPEGQVSFVLHRGGEFNPQTGKVEGGEIIAEKEVKNLIVETASVLMARRLAPGDSPTDPEPDTPLAAINGLQYLAVGVGELQNPSENYDPISNKTTWDLQNPPKEQPETKKLAGEIFRKSFTNWSFMSGDIPSSMPTNVLRLVTTFDTNEAAGPLVEMGLFGGDATDWSGGAGKNTGIMFNYKTFPVWNKPADAQLTITWKLTF